MNKYRQLELLLYEIELAIFNVREVCQPATTEKKKVYYQIKENRIKNRILYLKEKVK